MSEITDNISEIYERKKAACLALGKNIAARMLATFRARQGNNWKWNNQTKDALRRFFTDAFTEDNVVIVRAAHGVDYGVWLELANNRKHSAIMPLIEEYGMKFKKEIAEIYEESK